MPQQALDQATCCQVQDHTVTWPWGSCLAWLGPSIFISLPWSAMSLLSRIFTSSLSFCISQSHFLLCIFLFVLALLFLETESFYVDKVGL